MAAATTDTLREHWCELRVARERKARCVDDVEAIKKTCEAKHGTRHVLQCSVCYPKVLDRMLSRYRDDPDSEWFSQRKAFVLGLEGLFSRVKEQNLGLKNIEVNVQSEKEAWYRWILRKHPHFLGGTGTAVASDEVKAVLDDPDAHKQDMVDTVWRSIGGSEDWLSRLDVFIERTAAGKDKEAVKNVYIEEFFKDRSTGETLEGAQKYLEQYQASTETSLGDTVDRILAARRDEKASQAQRDADLSRLDELRRAKTAFEQAKALNKAQLSGTQAAAGEQLYDLPTCSVCQSEVRPSEVLSCSVCQVICQIGGDKEKLTVYCSEGCYQKGQGEHIEKEHDCEAGNKCVQEGDEDMDMEDDASSPVACNECLSEKRATLFCSPRCASRNLNQHREAKHGFRPGQPSDDVQGLVTPLQQVVEKTLAQENPGLKYTWMP